MREQQMKSVVEFTRNIPAKVQAVAHKIHAFYEIEEQDHEWHGKYRTPAGTEYQVHLGFNELNHGLEKAGCTCKKGKKGEICSHLAAFANTLLEIEREAQASESKALEFLDKYLSGPLVGEAQYRLIVDLEITNEGLAPAMSLQRRLSGDKFSAGKKLSANDSYKNIHTDAEDHRVLAYVRNFRQILFYSNYSLPKKYGWGFWLSLVEHPRLFLEDQKMRLVSSHVQLHFEKRDDGSFLLVPRFADLPEQHWQLFAIEDGVLGLNRDEGLMALSQVDARRCEMVLELDSLEPVLTKKDLLRNMTRLERLQSYFEVSLPVDLADAVRDGQPELLLQLDMELEVGFLVKPRIAYKGSAARVVPGMGSQYLAAVGDQVVRRNFEAEVAHYEDFLDYFPYEEEPSFEHELQIVDLERAFTLIDWLKQQDRWPLEWLRKEPVRHQLKSANVRVEIDSNAWLKIHLLSKNDDFVLTQFHEDDQHLSATDYVAVNDGEWVQIDSVLREQLNQLKLAIKQEQRALKLKKSAFAILAEMEALEWVGDRDWIAKLEHWRKQHRRKPRAPKQLKAELRSYQLEGYAWLKRMSDLGAGVCLADDMGLGKTVQALAIVYDRLKEGPVMVIAPASVCFNWQEEIEKFAPDLTPLIYAEMGRTRLLPKLAQGQVVIISYAMVLRDIDALQEIQWGTLILDEAQFVKNAVSQTAMAVARLKRAWTLALTGTPLENHLGELWSIFRMLNPGLLGSWEHFRKSYVAPIKKEKNSPKIQELRQLIRPFILRRTKRSVLADLPERTEQILKVEMPDLQKARYQKERKRILSQLDQADEKMRFKLLAAITRLRQLACHPLLCDPKYKGESGKLKLFGEYVAELVSEGHRALVFSQFTSFLELIARELNRIHVNHVIMTGQTPVKHRQNIIRRFQEGEVPLFLVSLRAGGTGINLTSANYVFHMDPWWNPAVEEQATDRAHRIGQTQNVTVYRMVASGTIEETILKIHDRKKDLVERLLDGQSDVGKLSIDDLVSVIKGSMS